MVMILAAMAFFVQGGLIAASEAAAAVGSVPDPAVVLDGPVHVHGQLPGHFHAHDGDNGAGHVHLVADADDDHADDNPANGKLCFFSCAVSVAILATMDISGPLLTRTKALPAATNDWCTGTEPDGLRRPPRPPGIA
jgi:hypothetical protein